MKNAIFASGAGLVLAVLLSSPSFAQTTPAAAAPTPTPVVADAEPAADVPLDELIEAAVTPEDRMRLLLRCSGPPPRPIASMPPAKEMPALEPATVAERATAPTGG
jgi:hypothetical protein